MIKLYTTGCPSCTILKKALEDNGIIFDTISDMDEIVDVANKHGFKSVPLLEVNDVIYSYNHAMEIVKNWNKGE